MAPKAETLFGKIERYLGQQANNKAQQIQQEGVNAYARGDTKAVRESTHQYDAVKGFPFELAERIRDVNDLIRKYGLDEIDIPIDEIKVSKDASRTEIAEAITTPTLKSKDRVQRSSNYKTGYGGIVGLDLIEKADRGGFVFNRPEEIVIDILKPECTGNERIVRNAKRQLNIMRHTLVDDILEQAKLRRSQTMEELAVSLMTDENHPIGENMYGFYEYAFDHYSKLSPERFTQILLRRLGKSKDSEKESDKESISSRIKKKIIKTHPTPPPDNEQIKAFFNKPELDAAEKRICDRLTNPDVLQKLQQDVLAGRDIYKIAGKNGWPYRNAEDAKSALEGSCIRSTQNLKARGRNYSDQEIYGLILTKLVPKMSSSQKDRATVSRVINGTEYEGIKFLNAVIGSIPSAERLTVTDEIMKILSLKSKEYQLPGMEKYD